MNIAIIGAGGVGGYMGGMLAQAGHRVILIARGPHLEAINRYGLKVIHRKGEFTVSVEAKENSDGVGVMDLIFFTVKTYDTNLALKQIGSMVGDQTGVVTLQNGIDNHDIISKSIGNNFVLPGSIYIETRIESPGVIKQSGKVVRVVLGELDGSITDRAKNIQMSIEQSGIQCDISSDIRKSLWTKFLFIASLAGVTAACRERIGKLIDRVEYEQLLFGTMKEIESVARAKGVKLDGDVVSKALDYVKTSAKDIVASMHVDLESGRRLELESLTGVVVRLAKEKGLDAPLNELLYLILKPHAGGINKNS
ncbi:2-dehydropantoate 2-reductase [SAR202 cluster bacterium AC-409-J13_OGT_754m]|nr:2-dehydropantoate 2-reductase [SAR202 cluster bacterium AC-409-J13_OGT_754m]